MSTDPRTAKDIFVELVSNVPPEEWENRLEQSCQGNDELRNRVRVLLRAHAEPGSFLEQPAVAARCNDPSRVADQRAPRHGHRPLQAAAADRRRRHGRGVHGRADRADPADRRAEDHQARHGHAAGDRPLRGRAAGRGDDGPSEYRQSARCRHDGQRPAVLRHGAGERRADHEVLRRKTSAAPRTAGAVHAGLPGGAACPSEGHHPSRHQAQQRARGRVRQPAPFPK